MEDFKKLVSTKAALKATMVTALSKRLQELLEEEKELLEEIEQVNNIAIHTRGGDTLLTLAARNGLTDVVKEMLTLKPMIQISNHAITTASNKAAEEGFKEVEEVLRIGTGKVRS